MRGKLAVACGLMALVSLTGFASSSVLSPAPLQAQACGAFRGPSCLDDCVRECTSGGCCSWRHYYYSLPTET
jgi:hypothetical protein